MTSDPRRVMERLVAAQNAHDLDAFVACFAPDYESQQPAHPGRAFKGNDQVRRNWSAIFAGVPDFRADLLSTAVERGTVWAELVWRGTRNDGTALHDRGVIIATIRDDRIVAARLYVEGVEEMGDGSAEAVGRMARGY